MQKFRIDIPESVLDDLRERLGRTRYPDEIAGADWSYGTDLAYLRELVDYWRSGYDWRKWEAVLNGFDQFKADVDGIEMHFIHVRSKHDDALPLLITHGWPGSVFEFHKIIGPLTDPESHGGSAADAFHVVCPSMPGYGWSQAPREPGFDVQHVATWHSRLMARLGYERYMAQGGDWGAITSAYIGRDDPDHCCGVHVNMVLGFPPENDPNAFDGLTEQDLANFAAVTEFFQKEAGYQQIQGTKPQTLGYGLNDSPAGLCA